MKFSDWNDFAVAQVRRVLPRFTEGMHVRFEVRFPAFDECATFVVVRESDYTLVATDTDRAWKHARQSSDPAYRREAEGRRLSEPGAETTWWWLRWHNSGWTRWNGDLFGMDHRTEIVVERVVVCKAQNWQDPNPEVAFAWRRTSETAEEWVAHVIEFLVSYWHMLGQDLGRISLEFRRKYPHRGRKTVVWDAHGNFPVLLGVAEDVNSDITRAFPTTGSVLTDIPKVFKQHVSKWEPSYHGINVQNRPYPGWGH